MKKRSSFTVLCFLMILFFSIQGNATVNNTYSSYKNEKGSTIITPVPVEGSWTNDGTGIRFTSDDGHAYIDEWLYYKKGKRNPGRPTGFSYFDKNGYLVSNRFFTLDGKIYYANENGIRKTGWFMLNGKLYYAYPAMNKGYLRTSADGPLTKNGIKYSFAEDGTAISPTGSYDSRTVSEATQDGTQKAQNGWVKGSGTWYYYRNGQPLTNEWILDEGAWYYLGPDGKYYHSTVSKIGEFTYRFDKDGKLIVSREVRNEKNELCWADENGHLSVIQSKEKDKVDGVINARQAQLNRTVNKYTDNATVQWFNAATAILNYHRGANIKAFGGSLFLGEADSDAFVKTLHQQGLLADYGIMDRASADRVLDSLLAQGASTGSAWDYSRAMSNLGFYYLAGYYSETEALDRCLEIALKVQKVFRSWDEFNSSYLEGYRKAANGDTSRDSILNTLKGSVNNPYVLDWNTPLQKSWQ